MCGTVVSKLRGEGVASSCTTLSYHLPVTCGTSRRRCTRQSGTFRALRGRRSAATERPAGPLAERCTWRLDHHGIFRVIKVLILFPLRRRRTVPAVASRPAREGCRAYGA